VPEAKLDAGIEKEIETYLEKNSLQLKVIFRITQNTLQKNMEEKPKRLNIRSLIRSICRSKIQSHKKR